ncbi:MAG: hypothetical protein IPM71_13025 [Bacteroidota bacterium]|nr:MAG: hypothetical protein IPM71_13025 [Bacteroidota bacterium]
MKNISILVVLLLSVLSIHSQVVEMKWELDYEIYLTLSNDSSYAYDLREAFHVSDTKEDYQTEFVFYPVNPGSDYAMQIPDSSKAGIQKTLWSALNANLGGGWVHFTNCVAYALEIRMLDLKAPLMQRPESKWKPHPMTESYQRTKDWNYYVPMGQKEAQKEYTLRLAENKPGDIQSMPSTYLDLFLNTSQKQYDKLVAEGKWNTVAKIDLIKLMLGSNYLGEAQISYISSQVLAAIKAYTSNVLPSVVVFDEFDAAALMSLDAQGYKVEKIVFRESSQLSEETKSSRIEEISGIVKNINEYNQNSFQKRLGNYYKN